VKSSGNQLDGIFLVILNFVE